MATYELDKAGASRDLAVHVNQDYCISAWKCVADEPTVFPFDDDEVAERDALVRADAIRLRSSSFAIQAARI